MSVSLEAILADTKAPLLVEAARKALEVEAHRRQEFREWISEDVKAEFINGQIIVHSPVKRKHRVASELLFQLVNIFVRLKKLGEAGHEKAMVSLTRNDFEPDIAFWSNEKAAQFNDDTMFHPAPDFVVEILSKKTSKNDRTVKFEDYARHGVKEYWIIDPNKQIVEQYGLLTDLDSAYLLYGKFVPGHDITSLAIPGFTIPVKAIFDEAANLEALRALLKQEG